MKVLSLIDIQNVQIETHGTLEDKARSYIAQIRNPYHYRYGKYEVEIDFVGNKRLEDKLISLLSKK